MLRTPIAFLLALLLALPNRPLPIRAAQEACPISPDFQVLRDRIPDQVGECRANEVTNPATGNVEQQTSGGLLIRRVTDNLIGFTTGEVLWLLGPDGLASRPVAEPAFGWEGQPLVAALPAAPGAQVTEPAVGGSTAAPPPCNQPAALPVDVAVQAPPAGLPPAVAAFSGIWEGVMLGESGGDYRWPVRFAVERIDASSASIVFAAATKVNQPAEWLRRSAQVQPGPKLAWTPRDSPVVDSYVFTMAEDLQHIEAARQIGRYVIGRGTLTRCSQ